MDGAGQVSKGSLAEQAGAWETEEVTTQDYPSYDSFLSVKCRDGLNGGKETDR